MRQEKLDAAKVLGKAQTRDEFVVGWSETAWPPEDVLVVILECAISLLIRYLPQRWITQAS